MWDFLRPNGTISIIAPASGEPSNERVEAAINFFEKLGYKLNIPANLNTNNHPFHSADDETRTLQLIEAINLDTDVILCARGGYGSSKVVELLKRKNFRPIKEKALVGFSDITALLVYFHQEFGWHTIHGGGFVNVPTSIKTYNQANVTRLIDLLAGKANEIVLSDLQPISEVTPSTIIEGTLTGGNLCLIQNTLGTSHQIKCKDKIVFLEDVGERGYKVDRMLHHLLQANALEGAKALVYGDIVGGEEPGSEKNLVRFSLEDFSRHVDFPIFHSKSFGHGFTNIPLILGAKTNIQVTNHSTLLSYKLK